MGGMKVKKARLVIRFRLISSDTLYEYRFKGTSDLIRFRVPATVRPEIPGHGQRRTRDDHARDGRAGGRVYRVPFEYPAAAEIHELR